MKGVELYGRVRYAVQIEGADGHNDGIYSFEGLRHMAEKA